MILSLFLSLLFLSFASFEVPLARAAMLVFDVVVLRDSLVFVVCRLVGRDGRRGERRALLGASSQITAQKKKKEKSRVKQEKIQKNRTKETK